MELFSRFVAIFLLLILSPVFLLCSLGSLFFQGSPVFFKQERVGFNYQPFMLYKFRSMVNNSSGKMITESNDVRITIWGKFLRSFKIDEIPQLWNIIKGDMRFIGPRPEVQEFVSGNDFSFLKTIKPGLTDFSSILFRNEADVLSRLGGLDTYNKILAIKLELGHLYTDLKNLRIDLQLVLLTIVSIILPKTAISLVKKYFIRRYKPNLISVINSYIK